MLSILPRPPKWLGNRLVAGLPSEKIRTIPHLELTALLRLKLGTEMQIALHDRNERFQRTIPQSELQSMTLSSDSDTSSNILIDGQCRSNVHCSRSNNCSSSIQESGVYDRFDDNSRTGQADLEIRADAVTRLKMPSTRIQR
jgi:hypothetical protein